MSYIEQAIEEAVKGGWKKEVMSFPMARWEFSKLTRPQGDTCGVWFYWAGEDMNKWPVKKQMEILQGEMFFDPEFWRCLGVARGWDGVWRLGLYTEKGESSPRLYYTGSQTIAGSDTTTGEKHDYTIRQIAEKISDSPALFNHHLFVDHLWEEKPAESFFEQLLSSNK